MGEKIGYIHLYFGDGKGKTSAAMGAILRALGRNFRVLIVEFLKDGNSGEFFALQKFPSDQITFVGCNAEQKFSFDMNAKERQLCSKQSADAFQKAVFLSTTNPIDLLLLDEITDAVREGFLPKNSLVNFLKEKPNRLEVILTGHHFDPEIGRLADYISQIQNIKHPFDSKIKARIGIEK